MKSPDTYQKITNKILSQLEKGCVPWVQPWKTAKHSAANPHNAGSKRSYNGVNRVILWMEQIFCGYPTDGWLTYKQAEALGGHVRKGEKGTMVIWISRKEIPVKDSNGKVEKNKDGSTKTKKIPLMREFWVFNLAQIDDLPEKYQVMPVVENEDKPLEDATFTAWVKGTKANIKHGGDQAYFRPSTDEIQMPKPAWFDSASHYKATMLHELTHWTGAKHRLDRDLKPRFAEQAYAAEELVAELGAAFLCADLNVDGDLRHADYIGHWIKLLKDDPKAIFTASSKATAAATYLHELNGTKETAEETELEMAA